MKKTFYDYTKEEQVKRLEMLNKILLDVLRDVCSDKMTKEQFYDFLINHVEITNDELDYLDVLDLYAPKDKIEAYQNEEDDEADDDYDGDPRTMEQWEQDEYSANVLAQQWREF